MHGYANLSQLSSVLFPKGSNDTPVDFLTNDHFKVLNMTFIHVILIRCYGLDLFNYTVIWYRRFWKMEADDGLLWIDYSIISINSSCCCPDIPEEMKKIWCNGTYKTWLKYACVCIMIRSTKKNLLQNLFLEISFYCFKNVSIKASPLKSNLLLFSLSSA